MSQDADVERPRGRPRRDSGIRPLDRAAIATAALDIAAAEGFAALTMRSLATRLDVTVRALYHHVRDRQDVIDLVAERLMRLLPAQVPDSGDWKDDIRLLYRQARAAYRRAGRALLFALDETVTPSEVPVARVLVPERMLDLLTRIGLTLPQALAWRSRCLTDIFGHALLIDHLHDRTPPEHHRMLQDPVPRMWLDAHPEVDAPHSRRATELADITVDDLFDQLVDRAIGDIERLLDEAR